jgi:hypothetical protein
VSDKLYTLRITGNRCGGCPNFQPIWELHNSDRYCHDPSLPKPAIITTLRRPTWCPLPDAPPLETAEVKIKLEAEG